jgi:SAM-dependent methyltransferase
MSEGIFKRNLTSDLLLRALSSLRCTADSRILDLGCGDGNIGRRHALQTGLVNVIGSDISEISIASARSLAKDCGLAADYRTGQGFDPWVGESPFDIISCDVAGISQTIASFSDWYVGVSCETGESGLDLLIPLISSAEKYLAYDGTFLIPVISLADHQRLVKHLKEKFEFVTVTAGREWPIPEGISQALLENGLPLSCENWEISEKFGINVATTRVAVCSNFL